MVLGPGYAVPVTKAIQLLAIDRIQRRFGTGSFIWSRTREMGCIRAAAWRTVKMRTK